MVDFIESLKSPFRNWKALLLGIAIGAMPVINILLVGFGLGEAKRLIRGKKKPMTWWGMSQILYDSIAGLAITLCYFLLFFLLLAVLAGPILVKVLMVVKQSGLVENALWGTSPFKLASIISSLSGKLAVIATDNLEILAFTSLVGITFYYLLPFSLVNYARKQEAGSAFSAREIKRAFNPKYFFYWALFHFYILVLFVVLSLLFFLPILNFLLDGFMLFVYFSTGFNLFTQLFIENR